MSFWCYGGILVSYIRGSRFETFYCNDKYFCHWIQRIQWKHLEKTQISIISSCSTYGGRLFSFPAVNTCGYILFATNFFALSGSSCDIIVSFLLRSIHIVRNRWRRHQLRTHRIYHTLVKSLNLCLSEWMKMADDLNRHSRGLMVKWGCVEI